MFKKLVIHAVTMYSFFFFFLLKPQAWKHLDLLGAESYKSMFQSEAEP